MFLLVLVLNIINNIFHTDKNILYILYVGFFLELCRLAIVFNIFTKEIEKVFKYKKNHSLMGRDDYEGEEFPYK